MADIDSVDVSNESVIADKEVHDPEIKLCFVILYYILLSNILNTR